MVVVDRVQMLGGVDDVDLVLGAQAGDVDAFAALYERYQPHLMRYCRSRLGNWEDAADATQESFLRAWRAFDAFGGDHGFLPWAKTIAKNVCTDALRRRMRAGHTDELDVDPTSTIADGEATCMARAETAEVRAALEKLSSRHREILWLREYEGWSYQDIADRQELDLTAVKSVLWRARLALRREILAARSPQRRVAVGAFLPLGLVARLIVRGQRLAERLGSHGNGVATNAVATAASSAASATAVVSLAMLGGAAAQELRPPRPVSPAPKVAAVVTPRAVPTPTSVPTYQSWVASLPPRLVVTTPWTVVAAPPSLQSVPGARPAPTRARSTGPDKKGADAGSAPAPAASTSPTTSTPTQTPTTVRTSTGTTIAPGITPTAPGRSTPP